MKRKHRLAEVVSARTKVSRLARLIAAGRATAAGGDLLDLGKPVGRLSRRASRALASLRG